MRTELLLQSRNASVIGTGLIALDVVLNERQQQVPKLWAGGTCGNVLAILAYLGWTAYPLARLNHDTASRLIRRDLRKWRVDLRFLSIEPQAAAPIIIQRLRKNSKGENYHSFALTCPGCGERLPPYKPITQATIREVSLPKCNAFFADRLSAGVLALAEKARANGAVVFFEPTGIGDESLFKKMLKVSNIVKYAEERLPELPMDPPPSLGLEIQTLGKGGMRYRSLQQSRSRKWLHVPAFDVEHLQDSAGAGDWSTAGLIHILASRGLMGFANSGADRIKTAVTVAQALAAWNCGFDGARGGMYKTTPADFRAAIERILRSKKQKLPYTEAEPRELVTVVARICSSCRRTERQTVLERLLHKAS